jgi:hypothetical protein
MTLRGGNKDIRNDKLHNLCSSSYVIMIITIIECCDNGNRNKVKRNHTKYSGKPQTTSKA